MNKNFERVIYVIITVNLDERSGVVQKVSILKNVDTLWSCKP